MNKKLITICLLVLFILPLFAEDKPEIKYKSPEIVILMSDGYTTIMCIDGLMYIFLIHSGAAVIYQMKEIKDGKNIYKRCECIKNTL